MERWQRGALWITVLTLSWRNDCVLHTGLFPKTDRCKRTAGDLSAWFQPPAWIFHTPIKITAYNCACAFIVSNHVMPIFFHFTLSPFLTNTLAPGFIPFLPISFSLHPPPPPPFFFFYTERHLQENRQKSQKYIKNQPKEMHKQRVTPLCTTDPNQSWSSCQHKHCN